MTQEQTIKRALKILEARIRTASTLSSPTAVRDYLRLLLHDRPHEIFVCVFLDAQHRVIASEELFRGTLAKTSVYPREVVKATLAHNAAAVVFAHNHPSGIAEPSRADELLTRSGLRRRSPTSKPSARPRPSRRRWTKRRPTSSVSPVTPARP